MRPTAAAALLAGVSVAALLAQQLWSVGALTLILLAVCLRAGRRARPYLWGTLFSAGFVFLLSPLLQSTGYHVLWSGPSVPVLGQLDVTTEELRIAALNALRLAAVGLAFAAYALLLDHDRLIAASTGRRSVLAAALATRLVPTLERDARRSRRGAARPRPRAGRTARTRRTALAAARGIAGARRQPRRGDGGARLRPRGADAAAVAAVARARLGGARRRRARRRRGGAVALASVEGLTFSYPESPPALDDVSLRIDPGEIVLVLGASGSGKSTLVRALGGLVPWFHGGTFSGRVEIAGRDTRSTHPSALAGTVATVFQDPEDQVVLGQVEAEIAFGLENVGTRPDEILPRAHAALASVGASHLAGRRVAELSGGELQRICLASALALRPELLLLDEPTSQLDPDGAEAFLDHAFGSGAAVVISEQRPAAALRHADRVVFLDRGRIVLDAPRDDAVAWLDEHRPAWTADAA